MDLGERRDACPAWRRRSGLEAYWREGEGIDLIPRKEVAVFLGEDVIRDHGDVVSVAEVAAHGQDEGGLTAVPGGESGTALSVDARDLMWVDVPPPFCCLRGIRGGREGEGGYLPTGPPMPIVKERCLKSRFPAEGGAMQSVSVWGLQKIDRGFFGVRSSAGGMGEEQPPVRRGGSRSSYLPASSMCS